MNPKKYPDFTIVNGKVLKHSLDKSMTDEDWVLCVPTHMRERVLEENHNTPTSGHLGNRRTALRICHKYFWPGMTRDIRRYVARCKVCLEYKTPQQKPGGYMYTVHPTKPWEVVCIDFVGPMLKSVKGIYVEIPSVFKIWMAQSNNLRQRNPVYEQAL